MFELHIYFHNKELLEDRYICNIPLIEYASWFNIKSIKEAKKFFEKGKIEEKDNFSSLKTAKTLKNIDVKKMKDEKEIGQSEISEDMDDYDMKRNNEENPLLPLNNNKFLNAKFSPVINFECTAKDKMDERERRRELILEKKKEIKALEPLVFDLLYILLNFE